MGARVAVQYPLAGHFTATARENSTLRGAIEVQVMEAPISPTDDVIAQVGYKREIKVKVYPPGRASDVSFFAGDTAEISVTQEGQNYDEITLGVKPLKRGSPTVVARLGASGAILSWKEVTEFEIEQRSLDGVILFTPPDGYWTNGTIGAFYMKPYLPGIAFKYTTTAELAPYSGVIHPENLAVRINETASERYGVGYFYIRTESGTSFSWSITAHQQVPDPSNETPREIQVGETADITAVISKLEDIKIVKSELSRRELRQWGIDRLSTRPNLRYEAIAISHPKVFWLRHSRRYLRRD
jgi:hypothetical protein